MIHISTQQKNILWFWPVPRPLTRSIKCDPTQNLTNYPWRVTCDPAYIQHFCSLDTYPTSDQIQCGPCRSQCDSGRDPTKINLWPAPEIRVTRLRIHVESRVITRDYYTHLTRFCLLMTRTRKNKLWNKPVTPYPIQCEPYLYPTKNHFLSPTPTFDPIDKIWLGGGIDLELD